MEQQEMANEKSEGTSSDVRHGKIPLSAQVCSLHAESLLIYMASKKLLDCSFSLVLHLCRDFAF